MIDSSSSAFFLEIEPPFCMSGVSGCDRIVDSLPLRSQDNCQISQHLQKHILTSSINEIKKDAA
jgi:hypothetical protein